MLQAQQANTTLPAEFFPDPPAPAPVPALPYAAPFFEGRVGESGFGVASCVLCAVTLLYTVTCAIGMTHAKGWDVLGWLVSGIIGNWIGCGAAFFLGLVGVIQIRRGRRWSIHGMWLSAVIAIAPLVVWAVLAPK